MGSRTIINVATSIVINLLHRCCSQNELHFTGGGSEKTINRRTQPCSEGELRCMDRKRINAARISVECSASSLTGKELRLTWSCHVNLLDGSSLGGLGQWLCLQKSRLNVTQLGNRGNQAKRGSNYLVQTEPHICTNVLMSVGWCQIHQLVCREAALETMSSAWAPT